MGERKSKNLWSGCEILANFSYNFHSELWTFGAFIRGSLNKKDPKSGKVTTAGTANLCEMVFFLKMRKGLFSGIMP